MVEIFRNMIVAMIGIVVLVGLLTMGAAIALVLLAIGVVVWAYMKLRSKGIFKDSSSRDAEEAMPAGKDNNSLPPVIEAEYEVVDVKDRESEKL